MDYVITSNISNNAVLSNILCYIRKYTQCMHVDTYSAKANATDNKIKY